MKTMLSVLLTLALTTAAYAENWPNWRGPTYDGATTETGLPVKFSRTENIAWKAELPGSSAATPVVWGDYVFVSSADVSSETLKAMCFDRKNGDLRWEHEVGSGLAQDSRSNYASPSPVTDGKQVVFFYGNGELRGYTLDGKELWARNIQKDYGDFYFQWTFSTSPVIHGGKLYLQVLQRDVPARRGSSSAEKHESYLLAMDPSTGKTIFRHVRPSKAQAESLEAFSTPLPFEHEGRQELVVIGGDAITGHDPANGKELWRWGTWNPSRIGHWRLVPSPVAGEGVLLACAPKKSPIYAIKAGGEGRLTDDALAWVSEERGPLTADVPTPAFYDGDFFVLSSARNSLSRVEPTTGKIKWTMRTPGRAKYESSPLAADGKIYIINFSAELAIIDAEDGELLNTIVMDEPRNDPVRSSIIASQGNLFVRTTGELFCVGK